ncbi:MAG: hypothetical protein EAY75_17295 [Bacteroidetes bacterium]|nr:MAG: hypothetical protein EAY75_17295 [Bacteroidota bacterium]
MKTVTLKPLIVGIISFSSIAITYAQQAPNTNELNSQTTLQKPPKTNNFKPWYADLSISRQGHSFGKADLPIGVRYLRYEMQDRKFGGAHIENLRIDGGIRSDLNFYMPSHTHSIYIYRNTVPLASGDIGVWDKTDAIFSSRFFQIGVPAQIRANKIIHFTIMPSIANNISEKVSKSNRYDPNLYGLFNNGEHISKHIGLIHLGMGLNYRGFFFKAFYERNFTAVRSSFMVNGDPFTVPYKRWVNFGVTFGAALRLNKRPILLYYD